MKTLLGAFVVAGMMVPGGAAWADPADFRGSGQGDKAPVVVA